jgi:hypothetical protein
MKAAKITFFLLAVFWAAMGFPTDEATAARPLSKELAPDVPPEVLHALLADAKVYLTGTGTKEVLILADPFCENSRKTYRQLQGHLEQIRTVRILWVSAFPQKGSDVAAAAAMKMLALGKGEYALKEAFAMDVPPASGIAAARKKALGISTDTFRADLGEMDLQQLKPELDQVKKNTDLAKNIGYTGTPHFIVDGRVLHGYSAPAIRIMLKQEP